MRYSFCGEGSWRNKDKAARRVQSSVSALGYIAVWSRLVVQKIGIETTEMLWICRHSDLAVLASVRPCKFVNGPVFFVSMEHDCSRAASCLTTHLRLLCLKQSAHPGCQTNVCRHSICSRGQPSNMWALVLHKPLTKCKHVERMWTLYRSKIYHTLPRFLRVGLFKSKLHSVVQQ